MLIVNSYSMVSEQKAAQNRVASLAKPGNKVILLDVGTAYFFTDDACTTIPASEENLRVVQQQN